MQTFHQYKRNIYSQSGEDGVILELLNRLGYVSGHFTCVEFGAWDGKFLSNTYHLVEKFGWDAFYIEGNHDRYLDLLNLSNSNPRVKAINAWISPNQGDLNSLDQVLISAKCPRDIHLMSIDIDSFDLQVWNSLNEFRPAIVVIEINSSIPPGVLQIHNGKTAWGNSFTSTLKVAKLKHYTLVAHTGNLIFVRDDLREGVKLSQYERDFPESLFDYSWVFNLQLSKLEKISNRIRKEVSKYLRLLFRF